MTFQAHHLKVQRTARYLISGNPATDEQWWLLHGYAQTAEEILAAASCLAGPARSLVAPEALSHFYRRGIRGEIGASWMTSRDRDHEIEDYLHYLETLHSELRRTARRLTVLGFSQGAATAARWVAHTAQPVQQLVLWGSLLPPDISLEQLLGTQLIYAVGNRDPHLDEAPLHAQVAACQQTGLQVSVHRFEGGHELNAQLLLALADPT